ncbi:molecular chaperone DnaJ [Methylobacterium sp. Leaf123]|uniref:J domain-containing protein n=1 Tax=Methylobacterium sp. Leaf123 TaxID=1736264 RepID=UPI0006FC0213|nr:DnaJ domain-containing protein [Methylobacterium sp. Leaf123]KQQ23832.1 molecular chaperone DnaJ [Methylobacterium sp. Leaf123]
MLIALGLLALLGFWWLGRRNGRLPFGLTARLLAGYALLATAFMLSLRGSFIPALLLGAGGLWLSEGEAGVIRRVRAWRGYREPRQVRTAALDLDLGTDGAPVDGTVLVGPFAGRRLSAVPAEALIELAALLSGNDPEGARGLEAYLDRRQPGWRVDADGNGDPRPGGAAKPGSMTEEEAYQVLGLERGASLEDVRTAHRTLMKRLHPDQGGSVERAARVNAARDRLVNRHR